ncbi:MAG TPA: SH3 domain-containing C40 family peptidase [Longimicrobium sp.]|nr:SH3 domain-containing C40 family peptidase [Longimicrobium sp.]
MVRTAEDVVAVLEEVRLEHAPDPRLAVFEVTVEERGDVLALMGACSEPLALTALRHRAAQLTGWREVRDEVQLLPEAAADEAVHGIVTSALAPMLAGPSIREPQVSQAVLGARLTVLRRKNRFLQCRTADGYIGWVHAGYVALRDEAAARAWDAGSSGGEPWIALGAEVRTDDNEVLVRLPWGARVMRGGDGLVTLPDGRRGRPHGELIPAAARPLAFPPEGAALAETAARWLGAPYLWGGVTMGGVDCSGFVQALYRLHGHVLPRDSDQQSREGALVEPGDFTAFRPGDLLFFSEEPPRVTHVVLATGGSHIIHASLGNGGVARNDLAGRRAYERELRSLFVCARRHFG